MSEAREQIDHYLIQAVGVGASDIHFKTGRPPIFRIHGKLTVQEAEQPLSAELIRDFVQTTTSGVFLEEWKRHSQVDYSHRIPGVGRFRVNGFHQRGTPGLVFRLVRDDPPTFEGLHLDPGLFARLCDFHDGIILICGATGSGKSSSLAAMINHLNRTAGKHIVTLEDPIEFNYEDDQSVITQREIGIDTVSFEEGLRAAMRQDPDVILIGEMRDRATFETALRAAETGHLVLSTLHAAHTQQAIRRLFEFFPPAQQEIMRRQISDAVRATVVQKLLPSPDGQSRYPAVEVLVADPVSRKVIQEGRFESIASTIDTSSDSGSRTFNRDILRLIKEGKVAREDGLAVSPNPKQLEMNLKGIFLNSGGLVS